MPFDEFVRTNHAIKRATESAFSFLNRCAWPSAEQVRALITECVQRYPQVARPELCARIRSGDTRNFDSAIFELFLHEYLLRLGFLLEPHPLLPSGSPNRPDFKVFCPDGRSLYLEATSASDDDGRDFAGEARIAAALQLLDDVRHPSFLVAVDTRGYPTTQPRGRALAEDVTRWLDTLDPDELLGRLNEHGLQALPELEWTHEHLVIHVRPIPVNPESRGLERRLIGIRNYGGGWIDAWTPIRDAVATKSRRYGEPELPLVIAVNVDTFNLDPIDEVQALFGQEQFIFRRDDPASDPQLERAPNGAWYGPAGARGKRCSGAWLFNNLSPYSLPHRSQRLYIHPWANHAVPQSFLRMPHALAEHGRLQNVDGATLKQVFALPDTWPD